MLTAVADPGSLKGVCMVDPEMCVRWIQGCVYGRSKCVYNGSRCVLAYPGVLMADQGVLYSRSRGVLGGGSRMCLELIQGCVYSGSKGVLWRIQGYS